MRTRLGLAALAALLTSLASSPASADGHPLTVEDAVQLALEANPSLQEARAHVDAQRALGQAVRGRLLPSVHVADELQHWNSAYSLGVTPPGQTTLMPTTIPVNVRDTNTNTFTAFASQPIVGLAHLVHEHDAQVRTAEAGAAQLDSARAEIREKVETCFVELFEARALESIAKTSEEELAEQLTIAEVRLKAGMLTRADVLRVGVSQANAKQQEIQAHAEGEVARARLIGLMGLPVLGSTVDLEPPTSLLAQAEAPLPDAAAAERAAVARRPEMHQQKLAADAAHHVERARAFGLLPDVDLEGGYIRTDGAALNPANAAYVGLRAQWAIWEWGATYYRQKAALAEAHAAEFAATAEEAVVVAQQTIESADEAYRVTKAALKAGTATTTDLLDAQAALTQARLNLTRARYEDALARVTLRRGLGTP
jgi:outer membrane protein TolC